MRKPGFGVVTTVVIILAIVAFVSRFFSGFIPVEAENRLAFERSPFLVQAGHQPIDWQLPSESAFREARREDRLILLVVGSACSQTGRYFDANLFTAPEIRSAIATNYLPIRVDSMENPPLASVYLPIARAYESDGARLGIPADFQVWICDPRGRLITFSAQVQANQAVDIPTFLRQLNFAVDTVSGSRRRMRPGQAQKADLDLIRRDNPPAPVQVGAYVSKMSGLSDDQFGGFPVNGYQRLWPNLWRLQLLGGRSEEFSQSIEPLLHSPTYDVLDGGFFTCSLSLDWLSVDYDKFALENAGMLQTLALSTALSKNPSHRWFAERTFDFLADEMYQNGTVAGGRIGDESLYGRSLRSSFSPKELRERVEDSDTREAIRNAFDLRVEDNPQMTPRLIDEQMPISRASEFEKLLNPLRRNRPEPKFTGLSELDVAGFCVARLIESARMLGDRERLDRSREFFLNLDAFRTGDVVVHSIGGGNSSYAYLGDYLAYADAALQYFLSTGNAEAFEHGLRVLRRGLFLFKGQVSGEYDLVQRNDDAVGLQDIDAPEICDGLRESATSQVIRLTNSYGRLLGKNGTDLVKVSGDSIARFSPFVAGLGPYAASFYCAFREFASLQYAIVVGPTSFQDSLRLATLAPGHIISPVSGPVKAPGGRPGVYLISETSSSGPYSVEQAARQLKLPPF